MRRKSHSIAPLMLQQSPPTNKMSRAGSDKMASSASYTTSRTGSGLLRRKATYKEILDVMRAFQRRRDAKQAAESEQRERIAAIVRTHVKQAQASLPDYTHDPTKTGLRCYDLGIDPVVNSAFKQCRASRTCTTNFDQPFQPAKPIAASGRARFESRSRVSDAQGTSRDLAFFQDGSDEEITTPIESASQDIPGEPEAVKKCISPRRPKAITFTILYTPEGLQNEGPVAVGWLNERLATSCRSCRFELPMDMRDLEKMTVQKYLLKYCKISRPRMNAYNKVYNKYKNKSTGSMTIAELDATLITLLVDSVALDDVQKLTKALRLETKTVDSALFAVICAVAERICYLSYIGQHGVCGLGRGYLECADFSALLWKIRGLQVDPALKRILHSLG